jgi:DNA-binding transcriptional LysR family regulator
MIEDMRHIRAFLAVARIGNFTRAASELHVSQSALTVQIKQLEDSLGVSLFDRGKRRVALTDAGRDVLGPLERILVDTESIVSRTRELTSMRRGLVTMAVLPSLAARIVPKAIRKFTKMYPGVVVRIRDIVAEKIIEVVKKEEVDFGISNRLRPDKELKTSLLLTDRLCAFVSRNHLLAKQETMTLIDLAEHQLIVTGRDSGVREILEDALRKAKRPLAIAYETNYISTVLGLAKEGLGIAILPEVAADMDRSLQLHSVAIISPVLSRKIEIIEKKDRSLSPSAAQMVKILKQITETSS